MAINRSDQHSIDAAVASLSWEPPDPGEWELDASHQAEPASATLQEIFPVAVKEGFLQAFALYGLPLSHMEVRFVNGWAYLSPFIHGAPRGRQRQAAPGDRGETVVAGVSLGPPPHQGSGSCDRR